MGIVAPHCKDRPGTLGFAQRGAGVTQFIGTGSVKASPVNLSLADFYEIYPRPIHGMDHYYR